MRVSVHGGLCIRLVPELVLVVRSYGLEHVNTSSSVRNKRIFMPGTIIAETDP